MEMSEQLTMLIVLILVLGLAYMGVNFWSKRNRAAGGGGPARQNTDPADLLLEEVGEERPRAKSRERDIQQRFQLQGRDAEMAAKVLKRMLKQDQQKNNRG